MTCKIKDTASFGELALGKGCSLPDLGYDLFELNGLFFGEPLLFFDLFLIISQFAAYLTLDSCEFLHILFES